MRLCWGEMRNWVLNERKKIIPTEKFFRCHCSMSVPLLFRLRIIRMFQFFFYFDISIFHHFELFALIHCNCNCYTKVQKVSFISVWDFPYFQTERVAVRCFVFFFKCIWSSFSKSNGNFIQQTNNIGNLYQNA